MHSAVLPTTECSLREAYMYMLRLHVQAYFTCIYISARTVVIARKLSFIQNKHLRPTTIYIYINKYLVQFSCKRVSLQTYVTSILVVKCGLSQAHDIFKDGLKQNVGFCVCNERNGSSEANWNSVNIKSIVLNQMKENRDVKEIV